MFNAATPVEQSLAGHEVQQEAQTEITPKQIEQLADFIERRLLLATGRLTNAERIANKAFDDRIGDALTEVGILPRMSLTDAHAAGMELARATRKVIESIAEDYFAELSTEAQEWGWAA